MSNRERREARRRRRDLKRAEKRRERQEGRSYERLLDLNHLHKAAHDAAKGVRWKTATQSYETHLMARLVETRRTLADRLEKGTPCQTHQPSPSSSPSSAPAASARSSHGC